MSELLEVAAALTQAAGEGQVSVLATVVRTEGSTYRRIGARMVVLPDGSHVGAVSAGCIETDVVLRAERVRSSRMPELMTYDTRPPEDLVWGSGNGCQGVTELLLEPLDPEKAVARAERFRSVAASRRHAVLATVIRVAGIPVGPGDQATLPDATANLMGLDDVPLPLRSMVQATARHQLRAHASRAVHHVWQEQEVAIAYEVCPPRIRVCVCGAGPDAAPLAALVLWMGWRVTVIDYRSAPDVTALVRRIECDAAVIMNHRFDRDLEFLAAWLDSSVPFIGVLGPRQRTGQLLTALDGRGIPLDGVEHRIHAPVGLDLGGETPQEIALSIVAEIRATIASRDGGSLRNRSAPIHDRITPIPPSRNHEVLSRGFHDGP